MGGKRKAPPPPDYTPIANASKEAAEYSYKLGKEQLEWAKKTYADDKLITDRVVDTALDQQQFNSDVARRDRGRYETIFQPLENDLVADARSYASPGRRDLEMGRAEANAAQQFETARQASMRNLESFGVDPSSTRFAALDIGLRAQQAASAAAAGNQASQMVDATGRALRSEALNIGKGYPGQVAGTYGTALAAGQQAVGSALNQTASGANTMGTGLQWQGQGNQALGIWGNTLTQGYNAQMQQFKANNEGNSGWGSALGLVGGLGMRMLMSDERVKENIEPVGRLEDGQTVYRYNFKGDPTVQIGLIAQEVEDDHPEAVAEDPRGIKAVDYGRATEDAAAAGINHGGRGIPVSMSPSGGRETDDVAAIAPGGRAARLNAGEFIIPKDVAEWMGEDQLQKLIQKARQNKQKTLQSEGAAAPEITMQGAHPVARALPVG